MRTLLRRSILAWLAAPAAVGLLTFLARQAGANAAAIGVLYLALVVTLAAWDGWLVAVAATVCLDLFFIPE